MKYLKQFGIILLVTCIGEIIRYFVPLPIPGSIYGLVIMFTMLCAHVIKVEDVREAAVFLIEIMPVMFIPAAAGLIESWGDLKPILIQTVVILVLTTIIVMAVTGKTAMFMIGKEKNHE
ncbi:MAG: CidA/LrgA family protein [Solobacterium sp.]|nr:CidA/LrgA family protein [Solobacterium sp.]MBR2794289.1 CidA/LrgA family protein [Solobacterium sp.]